MSLGWRNPLPFEVGGGLTQTEQVYEALRSALGKGGPGPRDGLRDLFLQSRAKAIAKAEGRMEAAMFQAFPETMGAETLSAWEQMFGIPTATTLPERQEAVAFEFTRQIDAVLTQILLDLQQIDPQFTTEFISWEKSTTVQHGRAFGALPGLIDQAYGVGQAALRQSTAWPNYNESFVLFVRYVLPSGVTQIPQTSLDAATDLLNDVLPAWMTFTIYTFSDGPDGEGFYLDGGPDDDSLLDQTAFGDDQ